MASVLKSLKTISAGARRFAAVDFDGRQLRVVYAERVGPRARVLKLAAVAIPEGVDVQNPREVGALLGGTLRDLGLRNVGVLMNVTRAEAVLKPLTLPPGTAQEDLPHMVQFQMERELPFRPEEAVIDFTVESHYAVDAAQGEAKPPAGLEVLVGAVRLPVVDQYRQIAEAAGVKLLRLGLRPYANMRCVDACTRRGAKETVLVVHFGSEETEIDMLVGNNLSFSRSVPVKIGEAGGDPHKLAQSVRTAVMEVARSVQSYEAVDRAFQIDSILVAGGTGVEQVAADELATRLGAPCELFNPTSALGLGPVDNPSAFISALGLAIGHSGADQLPFDFLAPKRPRERRNRLKIAAVVAGVVGLLAVASLVAAAAVRVHREELGLDEIRSGLSKEQAKQRKLRPAEKCADGVVKWQKSRQDWLTHWAYLSALFPSCQDAYIGALKTFSDGSMTFTIKARDSRIVTDLGKRLTEAGYRFQPGGLVTARDAFGYEYSADVRVFVGEEAKIELTSVKPIPRPGDDDSAGQLMAMAERLVASANPGSPSAEASTASPAGPGVAQAGAPEVGYAGGQRVYPPGMGPPGQQPTGPAAAQAGQLPEVPDEAKAYVRRRLLEQFDRDHNGRVEGDELRRGGYEYATSKLLKYFDTNHNGRLEGDEYALLGRFIEQLW
jgi:Tfp pilus assembly PilM family ATPase